MKACKCALVLFMLTASSSQLPAQFFSIPPSGTARENFDGMGSGTTLPSGWRRNNNAGITTAITFGIGGNGTVAQVANSGTPTSGGSYNWGTTAGTDRAVGHMTGSISGGTWGGSNCVMVNCANLTGADITQVTIRYRLERYRGNASTFRSKLYYSTNGSAAASPGIPWTEVPAGDVTAAAFPASGSAYSFATPRTIYKTATISVSVPVNSSALYFMWTFENGPGDITDGQGIGLDDVVIQAGTGAPAVSASLRDVLQMDVNSNGVANPGDGIRYNATIRNRGNAVAAGTTYSSPAVANTTPTGTTRTSALARDDNYLGVTAGATFSDAAPGVLFNDYGLPAKAVASFGNSTAAGATAAGGTASSDNGASVTVNTDGSFSYGALAGFVGYDQFAYTATTGNAPDNDAIVTIGVGTPATAISDAYSVIGNVGIAPNAGAGVLANDLGTNRVVVAVNGDPAAVDGTAVLTSGILNMAANGSFTYYPNAGFTGQEIFNYTVDNGFATPHTANCTLTVTGNIWFVDAAAVTNGTGTLQSPFNNLQSFILINNNSGNNPGDGDALFLYENATAYSGNLVLLPNQRVIGQDAGNNLVTLAGASLQTYTLPLPGMFSGNSDRSTINSTTGTTLALSTNNHLYGFTINGVAGLSGSGFGTLTGADVAISTTGQALALTTGTSAMNFSGMSSGGGTNGVALTGVAGTMNMNNPGTITGASGAAFLVDGGTLTLNCASMVSQANNAAALLVQGGHTTGTLTFSAPVNATAGTGLQFDNADGTYNLNGANILTASTTGHDAGIHILNGSSGTFSFSSGTTITRNGVSGEAFEVVNSNCNVTYNGSITMGTGTGNVVFIDNHDAGAITFNTGSLSRASGSTRAIVIEDCGGGTITFNNPSISVTTSSTGNAVALNNNGGAVISFAAVSGGGLDIVSSSGSGFTATGGGTVTVTGTGNTISSGTGTALNVVNTTIGASGLTFQSISASGATHGILLNGTGTSGGLTVTGTGSTTQGGNSSGGTIQNTTSYGISLTSTMSPSFNNMNIQNAGDDGIDGTLVTNFSFTNGTINSCGKGSNEGSISFKSSLVNSNLSGVVNISNNNLTASDASGVNIQNGTGTLSDVTISNNVMSGDGPGEAPGGAVKIIGITATAHTTKATLTNNTITSFDEAGFVLQANGGNIGIANHATNKIVVTGNLMDGGNLGIGNQPDRFVTATTGGAGGAGQGNFDISNNGTAALPIRNIDGVVIELTADGSSTITATINNNYIVANNAVVSSGIAPGADNAGHLTVSVSNNTISQTDGPGIWSNIRNGATANITVKNNNVAAPYTTNAPRSGIRVYSGSSGPTNATVCLDIRNNVSAGSTNTGTGNKAPGIELRRDAAGDVFGLEGLSGGTTGPTCAGTSVPAGTPDVENFVNCLNPLSASGTFGVGGTFLQAQSNGYTNCGSAPDN